MLRELENRFYRLIRDPDTSRITDAGATPLRPETLRGHKFCLLSTYRASGVAVHTPVWFGIADSRVYIRSGATDGKVKRLRRNPRVLVTPCTGRGKPVGDPMHGVARLLPSDEQARAENAIKANYGLERRVYRMLRRNLDAAYIEVAHEPD